MLLVPWELGRIPLLNFLGLLLTKVSLMAVGLFRVSCFRIGVFSSCGNLSVLSRFSSALVYVVQKFILSFENISIVPPFSVMHFVFICIFLFPISLAWSFSILLEFQIAKFWVFFFFFFWSSLFFSLYQFQPLNYFLFPFWIFLCCFIFKF